MNYYFCELALSLFLELIFLGIPLFLIVRVPLRLSVEAIFSNHVFNHGFFRWEALLTYIVWLMIDTIMKQPFFVDWCDRTRIDCWRYLLQVLENNRPIRRQNENENDGPPHRTTRRENEDENDGPTYDLLRPSSLFRRITLRHNVTANNRPTPPVCVMSIPGNGNRKCIICYEEGADVAPTCCGSVHRLDNVFHLECLTTWNQRAGTCPMCRENLQA